MSAPPGAAHEAAAGRLARLHLRTGLLRLARVELEELAGDGRLDAEGVLDLAEARWRTGDLRGATEAAGAWLDAADVAARVAAAGDAPDPDMAGGNEEGGRARALAHALIADGLTVRGRHDDAAVHVAATIYALQAGLAGSAGSVASALDVLFAGIPPRADAWPAFEPGDSGAEPAGAVTEGGPVRPVLGPSVDPADHDSIAAAGERLAAGDDAAGAVLLLLALRATPGRAREILVRADAALAARPGAALLLARAEALRVLGRHEAAGIAYAVADTAARGGAPATSPPLDAGAVDPRDVRGTAPDAPAVPDPDSTDPNPNGARHDRTQSRPHQA